jgi:two-component system sensor histidine kinase/response regulator
MIDGEAGPLPVDDALDATVIAQLRDLGDMAGEDLIGQLVELFVASAAIETADLRRALEAGDATAVARIAHSLRGSSANVGARGLAQLCATLERNGCQPTSGSAWAVLAAAEVELTRVCASLRAL